MAQEKKLPLFIVTHFEEIISSIAIAAMLVICSCNVFCRYFLRNAISWADEVEVCLLAWTTFVGSAAAYKRNLHYGMDFVVTHVPTKAKRAMRLMITALICATSVFLVVESFILTANAQKVMPYTRLSYKWIDASAVVGFGSIMVYSFVYLVWGFVHPAKFDARYFEAEESQSGYAGEEEVCK